MPVKFNYDKSGLTAVISGEIDHHTAAEMRIMTDGELERSMPRTLTFDMRDVTFMDSSGVGLILGRARAMKQWGGKIRITEPPERVEKMLKLSGLAPLIAKRKGEQDKNA